MDRFRIISKLGAGGFGEAFRAWDTDHGVPVVLKRPLKKHLQRPDVLVRFDREINRLFALTHPHIVPIIAHGHDSDGLPYLAMRFLPAGSLADRKKPHPFSFLHRWLPSVAAALDHVHAHGIVHRDVKPANIFFDTESQAYLGDFGIAKVIDEDLAQESEHSLTSTGGEIGTYPYMGPEFFHKPRVITGAYDQYALAITVYEMVCGRRPFSGDSGQLIVAHATQDPPDLRALTSDAPVSLCEAVKQALAKKPEHRFATCAAFAEAALSGISASVASEAYRRFLSPCCHKLIRVPTGFGGRSCRCPACDTALRVAENFDALWRRDEAPAVQGGDAITQSRLRGRRDEALRQPSATQDVRKSILIPQDQPSRLVPESLARTFTIFPLSESTDVLRVAALDPDDLEMRDALRFAIDRELEVLVAPREAIIEAIDAFYPIDGERPVIRLVNLILAEAIESKATAIHLTPRDEDLLMHYRIGDQLEERERMPRRLLGAVICRLKILFDLDIEVNQQPQEAALKAICADGGQCVIWARFVPTSEGQSVVMRIM